MMTPIWLTDRVTSDLDRALHYTMLWGLEGVELRTVGGAADRVPHVNEEKLRRRLAEHEIPVMAVVPGLFEGLATDRLTWLNEVLMLGELGPFCQRVGCGLVVASGFAPEEDRAAAQKQAAEALRRAGDALGRFDVTLAVLNEADMAHATAFDLAELLIDVDHDRVQAAWNPAVAWQAGEEPADGLLALTGNLALVRCADGHGAGEAWTPAVLGTGDFGWDDLLADLHDHGYDGPLSLELSPVDGLTMAIQGGRATANLIKMLRAAQR